jgi:hypothetical protein
LSAVWNINGLEGDVLDHLVVTNVEGVKGGRIRMTRKADDAVVTKSQCDKTQMYHAMQSQ